MQLAEASQKFATPLLNNVSLPYKALCSIQRLDALPHISVLACQGLKWLSSVQTTARFLQGPRLKTVAAGLASLRKRCSPQPLLQLARAAGSSFILGADKRAFVQDSYVGPVGKSRSVRWH